MQGKQNVKFQKKKQESMSIMDFFEMFPDDESCLQHIFDVRFGQGHTCPKCERESKWYRIKAERAFSCGNCGHHLHPTVNTPFAKTRTPLRLWFYAIYLFTTSRHGVSGKELERQLGVTYKTAWRMGHEIRKHMAEVDGDPVLENEVEVDETYIGGYKKGMRGGKGKAVLMGMLERDGDIVTEVVESSSKKNLLPHIDDHIEKGATVYTDELRTYKSLPKRGYKHESVNHGRNEWVKGKASTNGVESFWKHFKASVKGTHIHISEKHLEKYAKEFEFRFNNRHIPKEMFPKLVNQFLSEKGIPCSEES